MPSNTPRKPSPGKADRFFSAFLLTENGRPKSGFLVYTLFLSFAFIIVYVLCYEASIRLLTGPTSSLPPQLSNALVALAASAAGTALNCLVHRFTRDKRMVFCAYLWLCVFALMVLATMLILLRGVGVVPFLWAFGWFILLPVALGTLVSGLLCRRDHKPRVPAQEEPEWKKYVARR